MSGTFAGGLAGLLLGAAVGSFLATVFARRGGGRCAWAIGRSRCDRCGGGLAVRDLLPVVSWLLLRGRCRHCGAPIALAHVAIEVAAAAIGFASLFLLGWPAGAPAALLGWTLLLLSAIDLEDMRLPDALTLPLLAAGLLLSLAQGGLPLSLGLPPPTAALAGAAAGGLALAALAFLYRRLRGREGLGLGDAKLAAAAGAWLGIAALPLYFLLSGLLGIALAVALGALRDPARRIPFGPALGTALWLLFVTG